MTTQSEAAIQALETWSRNDQERRRALSITLSEPEKHEDWCDSVTKMLTSLPPKPAPCNCKRTEPEQEPVAWRWVPSKVWHDYVMSDDPERAKLAREHGIEVQPLYTTPPAAQSQWVGLTYDEVAQAYRAVSDIEWALGGMDDATPFARAIEARLKEKNT